MGIGDIRKIGATLDHMMKHNEIDETTQIGLRIWFAVNEQIPSDVAKMFGMLPPTTQSIPQKKLPPKKQQ